MSNGLLRDLRDSGHKWLYRGVPAESAEVSSVTSDGEVYPARVDRAGEYWRQRHTMLDDTETAYTSWTTERSIAEAASSSMADEEGLSGQFRILRVQLDSLSENCVFEGRNDEYEFLIEGTVEGVDFSDDPASEDEETSTEEENDD